MRAVEYTDPASGFFVQTPDASVSVFVQPDPHTPDSCWPSSGLVMQTGLLLKEINKTSVMLFGRAT